MVIGIAAIPLGLIGLKASVEAILEHRVSDEAATWIIRSYFFGLIGGAWSNLIYGMGQIKHDALGDGKPGSLLRRWLLDHNYKLIDAERRFFLAGPFTWAQNGFAYRIKIATDQSAYRIGWLWLSFNAERSGEYLERTIWDTKLNEMPNQSTDPAS